MKKQKQQAFQDHKTALQIIFSLGKGLMFRKHLVHYLSLAGYSRRKTDKTIRELIESELLEVNRLANSHYYKLTHYSIYTLLGRERHEIDPVRVTMAKIMRSAFLNARILHHVSSNPVLQERGIELILKFGSGRTSYCSLEKRAYQVLEKLYTQDKKNTESTNPRPKILASSVSAELYNLRDLHNASNQKKKEREEPVQGVNKKQKKHHTDELPSINLNGLQSRDIYFASTLEQGIRVLHLDFVDLRSSMNWKKLRDKMVMALTYMKTIFYSEVEFRLNVLVASKIRADYFESRMERIVMDVGNISKIRDFETNVIDLNLEQTLFAGMTFSV